MEQTKKITEEQLKTVVSQQKELNALLTNIGILETQKHGLLHKIAEVNKVVEDFKSELQSQYGNVNINMLDGTYTDIEEEQNDEVKYEEVK
jgi:predicted  nucleic acid-binding Zn-ribbon protein